MLFECHITIAREHHDAATAIAAEHHWKQSKIDGDPILGNRTFAYLTKHGSEYQRIYEQMKLTVGDLQRAGIPALREKIELIMHDTKTRQ